MQISDSDFRRLLARAPLFNRRREWLAVGIGAVGGVVLWRSWEYLSPGLTLYTLLSGAVGLGLTGVFAEGEIGVSAEIGGVLSALGGGILVALSLLSITGLLLIPQRLKSRMAAGD